MYPVPEYKMSMHFRSCTRLISKSSWITWNFNYPFLRLETWFCYNHNLSQQLFKPCSTQLKKKHPIYMYITYTHITALLGYTAHLLKRKEKWSGQCRESGVLNRYMGTVPFNFCICCQFNFGRWILSGDHCLSSQYCKLATYISTKLTLFNPISTI